MEKHYNHFPLTPNEIASSFLFFSDEIWEFFKSLLIGSQIVQTKEAADGWRKAKKEFDRHAAQFFVFTLSEEKLFSAELSFFFNAPLIVINPLQAHFIKKKNKIYPYIRVKKIKETIVCCLFVRRLIFVLWFLVGKCSILFSRYVRRIGH